MTTILGSIRKIFIPWSAWGREGYKKKGKCIHTLSQPSPTQMLEREALLNVALDQQLVSLLVQCVTEFSEGRFTNLGCSLPSLLDWAWAKVAEIKASSDNLCESCCPLLLLLLLSLFINFGKGDRTRNRKTD